MKYAALPLVVVSFLAAGCASIVSGSSKTVQINSSAPNSKVLIVDATGNIVRRGAAPMAAELPTGSGYFSGQGYKVTISSPGYKAQFIDILPRFNPWYIGNIFMPPIVSEIAMLAIDPVSGAFFTLDTSQIDAQLVPGIDDIGLIERENAAILRARAFQVSRFDYTARQQAKAQGCLQLAAPEVKELPTGGEQLIFECRDGRQLAMACRGGDGCR